MPLTFLVDEWPESICYELYSELFDAQSGTLETYNWIELAQINETEHVLSVQSDTLTDVGTYVFQIKVSDSNFGALMLDYDV